MASEISLRHTATGDTLYYTLRNASRQYWNTDTDAPAFETLTVANWYNASTAAANYWIAMTESPASSYFYVGDWPATSSAVGWNYVDVYQRLGATPAISDQLLATLLGYWNGTAFTPEASDVKAVDGTAQTARDLGLALPAVAPAANGGLPTVNASNYVAGVVDPVTVDAWQIPAEFAVTGTLDPAVAGSYYLTGACNGQPYYFLSSGWYLWFSTFSQRYVVSSIVGTTPSDYWINTSAIGPVGTYNPIGSYTGTMTVAEGELLTVLPTASHSEADQARLFTAAGLTSTKLGYLDASIDSRMATFTYTAPDNTTLAKFQFASGAGPTYDVKATLDSETVALSASQHVIVDSGTVTTLTNLPAAPADWLTAAAVKADAVTKVQSGLALEATLTAIKGAGWSTETLAAIDVLIDAIKAKTDLIGTGGAIVNSPWSPDGTILTLVRGESYTTALSRPITVVDTDDTWPALSGSPVLTIRNEDDIVELAVTGTLTTSGGHVAFSFEVTHDDTDGLRPCDRTSLFDAEIITTAGDHFTPKMGTVIVKADQTR